MSDSSNLLCATFDRPMTLLIKFLFPDRSGVLSFLFYNPLDCGCSFPTQLSQLARGLAITIILFSGPSA